MRELTAIMAVVITACLVYIIRLRREERRLMESLDSMLEKAIDGEFRERDYSERMLSSIEQKMAKYLAASERTLKTATEERENIKSLVSDISHQTRTPVANIALYTQLLAEKGLDGESAACVRAIESQSEKLRSLMEALIKTSRLETGIIAMKIGENDLASIAERAVEQYKPAAGEKNIVLTSHTKPVDVLCDPKWTEEALCNILDNAVKYTPEGGSIRLEMTEYEMFCRVDITDTGIGVPEDEQAKIFARFRRGEGAKNSPGLGIGLYLTRRILTEEGGYIKVKSAVGRGSRFSVFLRKAVFNCSKM